MKNYDNEQRLRILQERLSQIKNKHEGHQEEQEKVDNTPPYPTYNPKATQNANEDVILKDTKSKEQPSTFNWKKACIIFLISAVAGFGGFYLFQSFDPTSLFSQNANTTESVVEEDVPIKYSLDFGDKKHLIILDTFDTEEAAKVFLETQGEGYFYLPKVSNSTEPVYQVYLGPYFNKKDAELLAKALGLNSDKILSL